MEDNYINVKLGVKLLLHCCKKAVKFFCCSCVSLIFVPTVSFISLTVSYTLCAT